jgi:PEP-CTERM/exosortase A-associated glycosyltransferase
LYGQGRPERAGAYLDSLDLAGRDGTRRRLIGVALAAGDPDAAGRLLAAAPRDDTTLALRGEHAYVTGRYREAVDLLGEALRRSPGNANIARIRGRAEAELRLLTPGWSPGIGSPTPLSDRFRGRILHLLTNSLPYREAGYTIRSQSVARCQIDVGLDPQMVTRAGFPRSDGVRGAATRDLVDGVPYHRLLPDLEPDTIGADVALATARAATLLVDELRPALLQPTTNHLNAQVALALGERFRLPVVYEVRGFLEETWLSRVGGDPADTDRYRLARDVETACMRRADAIVTLSETMRTDIVRRGGIDPDRVTVVPNAVEIERFEPGPRDPDLARALGVEPGEPVVGYISSFSRYEGIAYLIEAVGLLRDRGRRLRLLLVGDGPEAETLKRMSRGRGLVADGTVIFTGRVPHRDVQRYYRTIDVFVVPRTNDRVSQLVTPLKPYEAMAMARPLVVSGVPALLEIIDNGRTGRAFRPEDPVSLANTLEPLLDDPDERARLGSAAREWVSANRTWSRNGRRYRELYERLGAA